MEINHKNVLGYSLGVVVDEYLNWDDQFKSVKSKICGGLASLKKLKNILPQSKLGTVYFAIVESTIVYLSLRRCNLGKSSNKKHRNSPKIAE